ncbi:MAG TPA: PHP domain-containing protein, partial [Clostridia bacterium]|nr:PHP domain-containing protein [Clostridia bacterium]
EIKLIADLHTHTFFSHGKGSIEANSREALKKNLNTIAITDHGLGHIIRGITRTEVRLARKQVDKLNKQLQGKLRIILGVEANIVSLDGTIDLPESMWDYFDIVLVGYHPIARFKHMSDLFKMYIRNALPRRQNSVVERNTYAYIKAIERYKIDILAHPGLMMPLDIQMVAQVANAYNTVLEINSKHLIMDAAQVEIAAHEGAYFAINSDAHSPADVGEFASGIAIAETARLKSEQIINTAEGNAFVLRNGFKLKEG